jgi:hypothetical protein
VNKIDVFVKQLSDVFLIIKIGIDGICAKRGYSTALIGQPPAGLI